MGYGLGTGWGQLLCGLCAVCHVCQLTGIAVTKRQKRMSLCVSPMYCDERRTDCKVKLSFRLRTSGNYSPPRSQCFAEEALIAESLEQRKRPAQLTLSE